MPATAVDPAVSVRVEVPEPGAAMDEVLNAAVTPVGSPEALRVMAELKPPEMAVVMVMVPFTAGVMDTDAGDAVRVNAGEPTVRVTDAV